MGRSRSECTPGSTAPAVSAAAWVSSSGSGAGARGVLRSKYCREAAETSPRVEMRGEQAVLRVAPPLPYLRDDVSGIITFTAGVRRP